MLNKKHVSNIISDQLQNCSQNNVVHRCVVNVQVNFDTVV